jgi:phospholipid/cholesterol/gamma-HCH transport system ATP-binding protein
MIFGSNKNKRAKRRGVIIDSPYHIEFQNVWKMLGGREILRGLSFGIRRGETFIVLGLSGTGKSVTIKHMIGLFNPDYGRVLINGIDNSKLTVPEQRESKKQFGYLFQSGALLNWMTIAENVALPLKELTSLPPAEIDKKVQEKLELVNLGEHGHKYPSEISGGMKKRAGLARAIVREPEIVLYDEPTSGLDPVMSREVDRLIVKLQRELGITSVVVTHDMASAYYCADRIGMLHEGHMLQIGTPEEIQNSDEPIVRSFVSGGTMDHHPADQDPPTPEERRRATRRITELRRQAAQGHTGE